MSGKRPGKKPNAKKPQQRKPVDPEAVAQKRERRAQAAALRAEEKRKARRRSMIKQVAIVGGIAVVAIGIVVAVMMGRTPDRVSAPAGFAANGTVSVGAADAPVAISVVEDFACPFCAAAHNQNEQLFASYADGEEVRVDYQPIAFLDEVSTTEYSSRALNAAACVVGEDPENWTAIHDALLTNQPPEGGSGLSDDELTDLAVQAGAERDTVSECIDDRPHEGWVDYTTHRVTNESDFAGTPAIEVNGKRVDPTPQAIDAAVQAALAS